MDIQVIQPDFDLSGYYLQQAEIALMNPSLTRQERLTKLKALIQRAYEQGVVEGRRDQTYFDT